MALLRRHRAAQVSFQSAARFEGPGGNESLHTRKNLSRLDYLNKYLDGREFLLDRFTVADAYLVTVLSWSMATPQIDFAKWPNVKSYLDRLRSRPSVAKALAEEFKLYKAEKDRHKAA